MRRITYASTVSASQCLRHGRCSCSVRSSVTRPAHPRLCNTRATGAVKVADAFTRVPAARLFDGVVSRRCIRRLRIDGRDLNRTVTCEVRRHAHRTGSIDQCGRRHDNRHRQHAARMQLECVLRSELDYGADTRVRARRGERSSQRGRKSECAQPSRKHPRQRRPRADQPGRGSLRIRPVVSPASLWSVGRQRRSRAPWSRRGSACSR